MSIINTNTNTNTKKFNLLNSTNLIVGLSLVAILLLVYLKNKNFELFSTSSTSPLTTKPKSTTTSATTTKASTIPATTIPLLNNDVIQNSSLVNFINRFIVNKNQQNVYISALADRQNKINNLSEQVINLINPTA
jgi:hypothetical protein